MLLHLKTLPIITGELPLLTPTHLEDLRAGLPLLAHIVLHQPFVPPNRKSIRGQQSKGHLSIMIMSHSPLFICFVSGNNPSFWSNKTHLFPSQKGLAHDQQTCTEYPSLHLCTDLEQRNLAQY